MEYPCWPSINTRDTAAVMLRPWDWETPIPSLPAMLRGPDKRRRKELVEEKGWNIYSVVQGEVRAKPIGKDNQPSLVGGLALDYDVTFLRIELEKGLARLAPELKPQFIEHTLSGRLRLLWVFPKWVPVTDAKHCRLLWSVMDEAIKADRLHPGLDPASWNPGQRWTNGYDWETVSGIPAMPEETLMGFVWDAAGRFRQDSTIQLDMDLIREEVHSRWPGRWDGDFEVGARGVRFWDPSADNPNGCMIKADGVVCVTGDKSWMSWEDLFGADWCRQNREKRLEMATSNIWFDGKDYHHHRKTGWEVVSKDDTRLALAVRGFSPTRKKGETVSEVDRLLHLIQDNNKIDGALPVVPRESGIYVDMEGRRLLNTSKLKALEPAPGPVNMADFKWISRFIANLFTESEDSPTKPEAHFLAWLRRAYLSLLEHEPEMGQAVFLCGPKNNGKTLLCHRIVQPLLGGRVSDPYDYWTGRTSFNSQLFGSFLWALNDADSPREVDRATVLARIKTAVVNPTHPYHQKFGQATSLEWSGRIFVTLNEDPGSVGVLPEVNSNTEDKLCFFATRPYEGDWPERRELEATIRRELPYFARWLIDTPSVPEVLTQTRIGVKSYFDPNVLELSRQQHYAYNFREVLKIWANTSWEPDKEDWAGSPSDLLSALNSVDTVVSLAREFKVAQAARALTTLSREPGSGVEFQGGTGRQFKIHGRRLITS